MVDRKLGDLPVIGERPTDGCGHIENRPHIIRLEARIDQHVLAGGNGDNGAGGRGVRRDNRTLHAYGAVSPDSDVVERAIDYAEDLRAGHRAVELPRLRPERVGVFLVLHDDMAAKENELVGWRGPTH